MFYLDMFKKEDYTINHIDLRLFSVSGFVDKEETDTPKFSVKFIYWFNSKKIELSFLRWEYASIGLNERFDDTLKFYQQYVLPIRKDLEIMFIDYAVMLDSRRELK